jgi:hypothetical protein
MNNVTQNTNERITEKYFIDIIQTDEGIKYNHNFVRLKKFLQNELNIYRYAINPEEKNKSAIIYELIQINGKIIEIINDSIFKSKLLQPYFEPDELNYIMKKSKVLFNRDNLLEYLDIFEKEFNRNTETKKYLYFKNKFAVVTKNENIDKSNIPVIKRNYELKGYNELPNYIWKSDIHEYSILDKSAGRSEFWTFLEKISGLYEGKNKIQNPEENDILHFVAIITSFAQYLDDYYSPNFKFVALLDQREKGDLDIDKAQGRTGKTVIELAISNVIKETVIIDGKKFNTTDNFAWQKVNKTTKVIVLDDLDKRFNLSSLYAIYSVGLTVNQKHKPAFSFTSKNNPKIILSTNYTIQTNSDSDKARIKEVELAPYYSIDFTPEDDFGHRLFEHWSEDGQWNSFLYDCLDMLQVYTDYGLVDYNLINVNDRKAVEILGKTLFNIVKEYFTKDVTNENYCDLLEDQFGYIKIYKDDFYMFYKNKAVEAGIKNLIIAQNLSERINDFLEMKKINFFEKKSGNRKYWKVNKKEFEAKLNALESEIEEENSEFDDISDLII